MDHAEDSDHIAGLLSVPFKNGGRRKRHNAFIVL